MSDAVERVRRFVSRSLAWPDFANVAWDIAAVIDRLTDVTSERDAARAALREMCDCFDGGAEDSDLKAACLARWRSALGDNL